MHIGSPGSVRFGTPQHLAGDGGHLADPEEEESEEVDHRVAFGPLEVDVWSPPGGVSDVQHQRRQSVGHGCALDGQDAMLSVHDEAVHVELGGELRRIGDGDFDEDEVLLVGEVVISENLLPLLRILSRVALVGLIGDEPDGAAGAVGDELLGGGVELDVGDP